MAGEAHAVVSDQNRVDKYPLVPQVRQPAMSLIQRQGTHKVLFLVHGRRPKQRRGALEGPMGDVDDGCNVM